MATPASAACVSFFDLPNRTQALHEPGVDYLRCFPVVPPGLVPLIAGTQGILPGLKYAATPRLRPEQMSAGCPIVDVLCQGWDFTDVRPWGFSCRRQARFRVSPPSSGA